MNLYKITINARRLNCWANSPEAALAMAVRRIRRNLTASDTVTINGSAIE